MDKKKIKLSDLVEDLSIYPRITVDVLHVKDLEESIRAGVKLPPIIVDAKTNHIVDGFHRSRAWRIVFGLDAEIEAIAKTYKNPGEMFLDALTLNAPHGKGLTQNDRDHSIRIAQRFKLNKNSIAKALGIRVERVEGIQTVQAVLQRSEQQMKDADDVAPRIARSESRTSYHMFDELDALANEEEPPTGTERHTMLLNALILVLENDALDWGDGWIRSRIVVLYKLISEQLKKAIPEKVTTGED